MGNVRINEGKIEIFKGDDKQYYFHIKACNGEILVVSEGYKKKIKCKNGIISLRENIGSKIIDLTKIKHTNTNE